MSIAVRIASAKLKSKVQDFRIIAEVENDEFSIDIADQIDELLKRIANRTQKDT